MRQKRHRGSDGEEDGEAQLSAEERMADDSADESSAEEEGTPRKRPAVNDEPANGEDDDDDMEGEELLDEQARTQALAFGSGAASSATDVRGGVLVDMELHNFLCHKFLFVRFGPHINFITGRNGSGKSAILAAIIVCLGGKTTFTNRGSKMRDLIMKGEGIARVTIGLCNRGEEAYRPEVYGPTIYVERTIPREGPASVRLLKLLNPSADVARRKFEVVSKSRDELSAIIEHFAILLDNSLAILTQDTAKAFLNSSTPSDKYKMFLRGTQLEAISSNFNIVRERQQLIRASQEQKRRDLAEVREARIAAEEKVRDLERLRDLERQIEETEAKVAWALVAENEELLEKATARLTELQRARADAEPELAQGERRLAEAQEAKAQLEARMQELQAARQELTQELRRRIEAERALSSERKAIAGDMQAAERELRRVEEELRSSTAAIEAEARRIESGAAGQEKARKAERLARIEEELVRVQHDLSEVMRLQTAAEVRQNEVVAETQELSNQVADRQRDVDRAGRALRDIEAASKNRMAAFGANMPALLQEIERARSRGQFKGEVVGPLGSYVRLKEPQWGRAVSEALFLTMRAFLVTNYPDLDLLRTLMRQTRVERCPVFKITPQRPYELGDRVPDPRRFTSILSVLEVSHPLAFNALIDNAKIERNILVAEHHEATAILTQRPANVLSAFLADGARMTMSANGSLSHRSAEHGGSAGAFEDSGAAQRAAEQRLAEAKASLHQIETARETLANEGVELRRRLQGLDRQSRELQQKRMRLTAEAERIREDLVEKDATGQLSALQDMRTQLDRSLQVLRDQYRDISLSYDAKNNEMRPAREAVKEQEALLTAHDAEAGEVRADVETATRNVAQIARTLDQYRERLRRNDESIRAAEDAVRTNAAHVDELVEKARQIAETRPVLEHSHKRYDEELKRMRELLKRKEREQGTLHTAQTRHAELLAQERRIGKALSLSEQLVEVLSRVVDNRMVVWLMNRAFISMRSKTLFASIVAHRGFRGVMRTDHRREAIEITVAGNDGSMRQTHQLSGGERSFSTMAFLLSLWEALDSPFHALDEYDVFMDEVNRKISTQLIIDTARLSHNKQFILISPLETHAPTNDPDINVVRLRDPVRETEA